jgi:hypothetical protein
MSPLALDLEPNVSSTATKRANSASSNLSMSCLGPGGARSTNYFVLMLKLIGILSHAYKGESNYRPGSDSFLYAPQRSRILTIVRGSLLATFDISV